MSTAAEGTEYLANHDLEKKLSEAVALSLRYTLLIKEENVGTLDVMMKEWLWGKGVAEGQTTGNVVCEADLDGMFTDNHLGVRIEHLAQAPAVS